MAKGWTTGRRAVAYWHLRERTKNRIVAEAAARGVSTAALADELLTKALDTIDRQRKEKTK